MQVATVRDYLPKQVGKTKSELMSAVLQCGIHSMGLVLRGSGDGNNSQHWVPELCSCKHFLSNYSSRTGLETVTWAISSGGTSQPCHQHIRDQYIFKIHIHAIPTPILKWELESGNKSITSFSFFQDNLRQSSLMTDPNLDYIPQISKV